MKGTRDLYRQSISTKFSDNPYYTKKPKYKEGEEYFDIASVTLTNFFGARIIESEDEDGHMEEGVFIPIDRNDLKNRNGKVNAYLYINKNTLKKDKFKWTHVLRMKYSSAFAKKLYELGFKNPYMGNIRISNSHIGNLDK